MTDQAFNDQMGAIWASNAVLRDRLIAERRQAMAAAVQSLDEFVKAAGCPGYVGGDAATLSGSCFMVQPNVPIPWRVPELAKPDDFEIGTAARAVRIAAEAAGRRRVIDADPRLSEAAKVNDIAAVSNKARGELEKLRAEAVKARSEIETAAANFYGVPRAKDTIEQMEDAEVRQWFAQQSGEANAKLFGEIAEGQHERVLLALMRSPVPQEARYGQPIQAYWRDLQAKRDPIKAEAIELRRERVEFLEMALDGAMASIPRNPATKPPAVTA